MKVGLRQRVADFADKICTDEETVRLRSHIEAPHRAEASDVS